MVTEIIMPKLGQTMEEGVVERWVKKEGDRVEKGDILLEITTDKATLEVESYASGILRRILVQEGETVPVTQVIALIAELDEELPEIAPKLELGRQPEITAVKAEVSGEGAPASPLRSAPGERIKASPLAKKLAREKGVDLAKILGTGPGGRITKEDVLKIVEAPHPVGTPKLKVEKEKIEPLSPMRKAIAELMSESKRTIPHYYLTIEVDMTESVNRRRELLPEIEQKTGVGLSFNHILIQAVARSLKDSPGLTSRWEGGGIISEEKINVGIAVSLDEGLIVPVLKEADKKGLGEIVSETESLISRAREKKLKAEEYYGAALTISNLGMLGIENFIPIIIPPQSAILGVGAIVKKPAVVEDKLQVRHLMKLTLSIDHRVADGAEAAQFLQKLKEILEKGETV